MKTDREMFVKKYREVFKVDKSLFVNDNGEFIDEFCQSVYEIWQARVPEGYVVVPKEPTYEMIDVGIGGFCFPLDNGSFSNHDLIFAYRAMLEAVEK